MSRRKVEVGWVRLGGVGVQEFRMGDKSWWGAGVGTLGGGGDLVLVLSVNP